MIESALGDGVKRVYDSESGPLWPNVWRQVSVIGMKVVAGHPARGGSKRLPKKNLLPLLKPLLAHSIEQARERPVCSRTIVTYRLSDEIAAISEDFAGAGR